MYSYGGTLIDFNGNRFKEYFAIGGYKTGEWSQLPDRLTVKVIEYTYTRNNTPNGISPTLSAEITDYRTLIYSDTSNPLFSFIYKKRELAVKEAKGLAANLEAHLILELPES